MASGLPLLILLLTVSNELLFLLSPDSVSTSETILSRVPFGTVFFPDFQASSSALLYWMVAAVTDSFTNALIFSAAAFVDPFGQPPLLVVILAPVIVLQQILDMTDIFPSIELV